MAIGLRNLFPIDVDLEVLSGISYALTECTSIPVSQLVDVCIQTNDRAKTIPQSDETSLHFTTQMTLSKADSVRLRTSLLATIEKFNKTVQDSKDEVAFNLNIDWFAF